MRTLIVFGAVIVLSSSAFVSRGVAGAFQSSPSASTQAPHDHEHGATARPQPQGPQRGMRGQMMAKKNAPDDELNRLVATMNAATGNAKIDAMAELLSRLVQQQTTANEAMKAMKAQCAMTKDAANGETQPEH